MTELKALAAEKSRIKMEEKLKEKENESTEVKKINSFVTFFTNLGTRRAISLALKTSLLPTLSVRHLTRFLSAACPDLQVFVTLFCPCLGCRRRRRERERGLLGYGRGC